MAAAGETRITRIENADLGCQAAVDTRETFGKGENVVDDGVADFAVKIAQLGF